MLRKDDVVYYKIKLKELFTKAKNNKIEIMLGMKEVSFIDKTTGEIVNVKP